MSDSHTAAILAPTPPPQDSPSTAANRTMGTSSSSTSPSPWLPQFAGSKAKRTRQILYLLAMQGLGAAFISGGINFAVSVAMYLRASDITMWILAKNTIAGDLGVTILIQVTISFIITSSLIRGDLRSGLAIPLQQPWPPAPPSTNAAKGSANLPPSTRYEDTQHRSTFQLLKHNIETFYIVTQQNHIFQNDLSARERFFRLARTALQGFVLACCVFPWFWGIAIAILAPIYSNKQMAHTWIPMVIKGVYGALLGLVTNPLIALMNLGAHDVAGQQNSAAALSSAPDRSAETADLEKTGTPAGHTSASSGTPRLPDEEEEQEEQEIVPSSSSGAAFPASDSRMTIDGVSSNAHEDDFHSVSDMPIGVTTTQAA
ncbi:unnamed protein product [Tilletia laevis]|uniref:Uncharacterized protein n=3 Tax=Tilletia TaxID=13289 RepID=A0A8X7MZ64_9BASI|nr:hypothetical protein CF336_g2242 [Tilletia laevis]KAE8204043.1 hypothetical protein CF328_g1309 [Tilletia controversa]KAE8261446.1 hypothetical protein A4X03_0g3248 [Tilletia caries]KAE8206979.1 hypothetical protein CF335_g1479 [Tilletia laevis]KAE8254178.1 hypothetical protein A4X06_0g1028 [Tilletia controversa]